MATVERCTEKYPDGTLFILYCLPKHELRVVFQSCSQVPSDNSMLAEFITAYKGKNITELVCQNTAEKYLLEPLIFCVRTFHL